MWGGRATGVYFDAVRRRRRRSAPVLIAKKRFVDVEQIKVFTK